MKRRYVVIWFCFLKTDWVEKRKGNKEQKPLVLSVPDHGRLILSAANPIAVEKGITKGMLLADARAIYPSIIVFEDKAGLAEKLLKRLAEYSIRYSPFVAKDEADSLILDATGCAHLWGGEEDYIQTIITNFKALGYTVRVAMTDTIAAAWAIAHYGKEKMIIDSGQQITAIMQLPAEALRIELEVADTLYKLGLKRIRSFISMQRSALRRRFGPTILLRLDQAIGTVEEIVEPVIPLVDWEERLPSLDPIITATGIEIAIHRLLETIIGRLKKIQKGIRKAQLLCFRIDGRIERIEISTNRASVNQQHLFKLFELKIPLIEPAGGIDLFLLQATQVEKIDPMQERLWQQGAGLQNLQLAELIDRLSMKLGAERIHRFIPDEHYWPERSYRNAEHILEPTVTKWKTDKRRPVLLLAKPEKIEVMAPVPDYPPMNFRYKGTLHKIMRADGPERIEQEWWLRQGQHRDYYQVEDEEGRRYWLFRLGHYADKDYQWYLHGYFS